MAVVVGQYIVTGNNKNFNDYALGLKYPYSMTNNTFELSYETMSQLKANLTNLLNTKRGERLGLPNFGHLLHNFIFEQQSEELNEKIYEHIREIVNLWVPQVSIQQIAVTSTQDMLDKGELEVSITFLSLFNNEEFETTSKVKK